MKKLSLNNLGLSDLVQNGYYPSLFLGDRILYGKGEDFSACSPIDGSKHASFKSLKKIDIKKSIKSLHKNFQLWQEVPAPKRGELIRMVGVIAREHKEDLAYLITLESGKIYEEALGEVQEFIDVCDFAVGLSRQLYGLTIASERYRHKMVEQWHPLGVVGIVTAFNFPMAVWAWNAMVALVCGNTLLWKPSSQAPLCAIACHFILLQALKKFPELPQEISSVVIANRDLANVIVKNKKVRLVSATGSVAMGKKLAPLVASRLGRLLLELGGNNGMIVTPSANKELALKAALFSAVGTAGQRCTTLRRLFVHKSIAKEFIQRLRKAYKSVKIGTPLYKDNLMGPLVNKNAYMQMQKSLETAKLQGGKVIYGGKRVSKDVPTEAFYVKPALVVIKHTANVLKEETFAPILYIIEYDDFNRVLRWHNDVPQGLSSSIFSQDIQETELFTSSVGSDCGIANVNIGTSGAEIGGAFGGEKDTGGGRESGSDAWKNYMRRSTNTINFSKEMPLSQGIQFDI